MTSLVLQLAIHQAPWLQRVFGTSAVTGAQLAAWCALALVPLSVLEAVKGLGHPHVPPGAARN